MSAKMPCLPACFVLSALLGAASPAVTALPAAAQPAPPAKLIILGFDGADANLARRWMDEGKLPNLARLRQEGTFEPLQSTIPSQTPVSWSTFSTGLSPGRHGVFDFLKRDAKTYKPGFAAFDEGKKPFLFGKRNPWIFGAAAALVGALLLFGLAKLVRLKTRLALAVGVVLGLAAGVGAGYATHNLIPVEMPVALNSQRGETWWAALGKAGKRVTVMRMPVTFPPKPFANGRLLAGLGVPDVSKRIGKPFYFTSELFFTPRGGGDFSLEVVELVDNKGVIDTEIKGPPNELFKGKGADFIKIPMRLSVPEDRSRLDIEVSGTKLALKPGEWSDWVHFSFPFNSLVKLKGVGKFRLQSITPEIRLYLSPINFDPENLPPGFDLTTPSDFVHDLTGNFGLFKTMGWMIDTWSVNEGTVDEDVFLEDVAATVKKDKEILDGLLAKDDWDVLFHYFEFTDRVQHIMYRFFDPQHPLNNPAGAAKYGGSILAAYQEMDKIVGDVMAKSPKGTAIFVVSDHGFASFRRSMNYNTWLAKNGFMTLTGEDSERKNLEDLFDQGEFFVNVDWSKTKAYALGLGQIYINVKGREAKGIVEQGEEYRQVAAAIKAGLEGYIDEETGEHPVAHVFTRDEAYGTYDPQLIPDLIPSNSVGYRVGWQDSLGGIAKTVVEPNTEFWSGDHCSVYPPLVPGILFTNLKLAPGEARMGDVMPTILELYGVQPAEKLDGKSLLAKR